MMYGRGASYAGRSCIVRLGGMLFLTDDKFASAVTGVILPIDCGFAAYSGV